MLLLGFLALGAWGFMSGWGWYILTHPPRLVLGYDRLRFYRGQRVYYEIPYTDVEQIALFRQWWRPWIAFLGVRLRSPERFDAAWPKWARRRRRSLRRCGFDMAFNTLAAFEPPKRVLETVLRCWHRFESDPSGKSHAKE
jgi:hypothetical protein